MRYQIGDCVLDSERRELQRAGQTIKLRRKVFDLLLYLVTQTGQALSKQTLIEQVWPGRVISDATLVSSIRAVRQAIGDTDQSMIETLHGYGYRCRSIDPVDTDLSSVRLAPAVHPMLPDAALPLVGRESERVLLLEQLQQADCRLLTVIGPGGIGKTRLILHIAHQLAELSDSGFHDGIYWVDLSTTHSYDGLINTVAHRLACTLSEADSAQQLLDYLARKQLLLILDNFEQLQAHSHVLQSWLEAASGVKLLVSSRLPLQLAAEWRFPLDGLPPDEARALFHARARRVQPKIDRHHPLIADICALLGGMPLAIEMAASWLRLLTPEDIARQLAQNMDLLAVTEPSIAPRQANMQDVLTQFWRLLPTAERETLRKLSVLVGGFSLAAAQDIADATLSQLADLADKALLQYPNNGDNGRYRLHELIRQYAAKRLQQNPEQACEVRRRHSQYYLLRLQQQVAIKAGIKAEIKSEIQYAFGNIERAWTNAIEQQQWSLLERSALALFDCCHIGGRYAQGLELFALAQHAVPAEQHLLHTVCEQRWMALRGLLGEQSIAYDYFRARTNSPDLNPTERIFSRLQWGQLAVWRERHEQALPQLQAALTESQIIGDKRLQAQVCERLAQILVHLGKLDQALSLAEQSLALWRQLAEPTGIAQALDSLGYAHFCQGRFNPAVACYQESLALFQEMDDLNGQALALGGLGIIGCLQHNSAALTPLQQSVALARQTGHRLHLMTRLALLAWGNNALQKSDQALFAAQEVLSIAQALGNILFTMVNYHHCAEAALGRRDLSASWHYLKHGLRLVYQIPVNVPQTSRLLLSCAHWLRQYAASQSTSKHQASVLQWAANIERNIAYQPIVIMSAQRFMQRLTIDASQNLTVECGEISSEIPGEISLYDLAQQCLTTFWRAEPIESEPQQNIILPKRMMLRES